MGSMKGMLSLPAGGKEHVTWSDTYSLGIKVIDDQHKKLLDIVNDLFNHASGNEWDEKEYFKSVIRQAVDYIKVHFSDEEKIMISTRYAGFAAHKKCHEDFILAVVKTAKDHEAGKRLTLTSFGYFLKDWILSHIAVMDRQYSSYFRSIATRKADGKLSITLADIPK